MVLYKAESASITVGDGLISQAANLAVTVTSAAANKLTLAGGGSQIAGAANALTITAKDVYGNVNSSGANDYDGDKSLTFGGAANSPNATVPTVTSKSGSAVNFGSSTTVTFSHGVSSAGGSMVLYKAESASITVTDGSISQLANLAVTVTRSEERRVGKECRL